MSHVDCEQHWREKIALEIKEAINSGSQINAYGAYLLIKNA